jgi:nucleoside-diphosphate-sugar epimerase
LERHVPGSDAVIHLACVSNDPSFDLDPALGKSINYDAFLDLVDVARNVGVRRFIFASSSSVYGVKEEPNVTEDLPLNPLTDYSKYKALCEQFLLDNRRPGFTTLILRPATVCGYSPRMRLDLTVNILTNHAVHTSVINVFGGDQMRPNIHIEDVTDLYVQSLDWPDDAIDGRIFNAGYENHRVSEIAAIIQHITGDAVKIVTTPTNDHRSYHICSDKIRRELGFEPKRTIEDAVHNVVDAFHLKKIPNAMTSNIYYNVKTMKERQLS